MHAGSELPRRIAPILAAIEAAQGTTHERTILIAIDGCGGAGKSTLAGQLAGLLERVTVVHGDDFATGNGFDWNRLHAQVLAPLTRGESARYQRYDWDTRSLAEWHGIEPGGVVICEGVSMTRRELDVQWDVTIWVETARELRLTRGVERDGEAMRSMWTEVWMPGEDAYVVTQQPAMRADFILAGDGSTSPHLTDGAIELRPLQCRDAETHVALEDEAWIRWLSDEPGTAESTREWIRRNLLSWASHGSVHNFGIWSAATGQLLGNIEANTSVDVPGVRSGQANVSYALGALARGQGHATRAVELICTYLTEIGYSGALICTDQANESSTRVAQRAGFTLTGERVVRDGHELQCLRRAL